jgi:hypothetical protein
LVDKLSKNDDVLIIVHGIFSHAEDVSGDFAKKLAEQRGYNKVVVFEYTPRPKALWFGDPLTSTRGGFNLVKTACEIKSQTGNDVGVFGHSQGTVVINRAAYYVHGSRLPWAPELSATDEMKKVRFKEVLFAGSTVDYDTNLKYLEDVIIGKTPNGEKALYNCFSSCDIATDQFQMYLEDRRIKFGIKTIGDDRNIEFEPKSLLGGSISEHSRVFRDADLFESVPKTVIPLKSSIKNLKPLENDLGGVDFTNIHLNYIYANSSIFSDGRFSMFSYALKAKKAEKDDEIIEMENATELSLNSFFIGLTLPESKFWVNLNPWEPDVIADEDLRKTDMGRIMLEADLQMKKDFCKYGNPCESEIGDEYWELLNKKSEELAEECMKKHPAEIEETDNVLFSPVTRHWIVPDKTDVYGTDDEVYIVDITLNIESDPVYEHSTYQIVNQNPSLSDECKEDLDEAAMEYGRYAMELEEVMILPLVVQEVNHGGYYSDLRQVYTSLALAQWYKDKIRHTSGIFTNLIDSKDLTELESKYIWDAEDIWRDYVKSFKEGEYHCWKNRTYEKGDYIITESRLYSSGGVDFTDIKLTNIGDMPSNLKELTSEAIYTLFANDEDSYYFGDGLYVFYMSSTPTPTTPEPTMSMQTSHQNNNVTLSVDTSASEEDSSKGVPGFKAVFAIVGLLLAHLLRNRR